MRMRGGFTFIEVLTILIVVGVGLTGAVALVAYGMRMASRSQGEAVAMATAVSVADDPRPRLDPAVAADWSYAPYDFNDRTGTVTSTATGFVNGLYVKRTETSVPADVMAVSGTTVYARSAVIEVVVYEAIGGGELMSFVKRVVRHRGSP